MAKYNYYGVIEAPILHDEDLTSNQKLLYIHINALSNKHGYCFASNAHFAKLFGMTETTISRWISTLREKGYVKSEMTKTQKGSQRKLFTNPKKFALDPSDKSALDSDVKPPLDPTINRNSTSNTNNTSPADSSDEDPGENPNASESSNADQDEEEDYRYEEEDWQYRAAKWTFDKLKEFESLHPAVLRNKTEREVLDEWAHQLELLQREKDEYTVKFIGQVLQWLLRDDNWWIETGNFASLGQVRQSKNGKRKIDTIIHRYKMDTKKGSKPKRANDVDMRSRSKSGEFK